MNVVVPITIAAVALGIGAVEISQATMGVGLGIVAYFFAIMARIVQAESQQKATLKAITLSLAERLPAPTPIATAPASPPA